jgi:hypothetical protein
MMESVRCATFPSCRPGDRLVKEKETDVKSNTNGQVESLRAVVSVARLVCGGELELLTAKQMYA